MPLATEGLVNRRRSVAALTTRGPELDVEIRYTREAPEAHPGDVGRLDAAALARMVLPAEHAPWCFVCGPTGFVEATIAHLVAAGHDPGRIKAERFGGTG